MGDATELYRDYSDVYVYQFAAELLLRAFNLVGKQGRRAAANSNQNAGLHDETTKRRFAMLALSKLLDCRQQDLLSFAVSEGTFLTTAVTTDFRDQASHIPGECPSQSCGVPS